MIDYLELLLTVQEQEEAEETPEFRQRIAVLRKSMGGTDAPLEGTRDAPDGGTQAAWGGGVQAGPGGETGGTLWPDTGKVSAGGMAGAAAEMDALQGGGYETGTAEARAVRTGTLGSFSLVRSQGGALSGLPGGYGSGAPDLYRQMVRAEQAAGSLLRGSRLFTVTQTSSTAPGLGAAELDEIFSRDARRYDGGFSLF